MKPIVIALAVIAIGLPAAVGYSEVPELVNYQGILTDSNGEPIEGFRDLTFKIYPDTTGAAIPLWTEVHAGVQVDQGLFNVILGSVSGLPRDVFESAELYMGITVNSDPEMTPRMRVTSVPWAYRACVADTALIAAGAGDGHSLDAADGAPEDVIYVDQDGYVGIAAPPITGYEVYLDGKLMFPYTGGLYISAYEALGWNSATGAITIGTEFPQLELYGGDSEPRLVIDDDTGNVGIHTDTPGKALDVDGTVRMTAFWLDDGAGADGLVLTSNASGVGTWQPVGAASDSDWVISGDDMYANVAGNTGIGTTAPDYLLHVINQSDDSFTRAVYAKAQPETDNGQQVWGVYGETTNGNTSQNAGAGVFGYASNISGGSAGLRGDALGPNGRGVSARATHTSGTNYAVQAYTASPNGYSAYFQGGRNYFEGDVGIGTSDSDANLHIYENVDDFMGIYIENPNTGISSSEGIYFKNEDGSVTGIRISNADRMSIFNNRPNGTITWSTSGNQRMEITNDGDVGIGTGDPDERLHIAGGMAVDDTVFGNREANFNDLKMKTNDDIQCFLEGYGSGALSYFQVFASSYAASPVEVFRVEENGDMWASGTKSAKVEAGSFGERLLYAVESPEVWFEDFGSGTLVNGVAVVSIDPMFAETVNLSEDYHVFLSPVGGWAQLYVASRGAGSFEVRDASGSASVDFSYRLVAKRRGYENVRLREVALGKE